MTTRKHLKRRARSRAARTGEPYATALRMIRMDKENLMPTTAADTAVTAHCSFCGKPDRDVHRLVAGPGVYICDQCIALSASIVESVANAEPGQIARQRSEYLNRSADEILAGLPALVAASDRVTAELARWVSHLRTLGTDWPAIASAAGMTEEAARQRFDAGTS